MKTMLYTWPFFLAAKASFNISIFLFGVSSLSIESTNACWTVCLTEVKFAVFVLSRDFSTELQISFAISTETFLSVKLSAKDYSIGYKSYSVKVLFPTIF